MSYGMNPEYQRHLEEVMGLDDQMIDLGWYTDDQRDAILNICEGRSVIYRCHIEGGKIRTTSGHVLVGNHFKDCRVNPDQVVISNNLFEGGNVLGSVRGRNTRNVFK